MESLLKKRGNDAVANFLLSWMYKEAGNEDASTEIAHSVRCFVSGSPFLSHAYFVLNSGDFPDVHIYDRNQRESFLYEEDQHSTFAVNDLDSLINQLSTAGNIKFSSNDEIDPEADLSEHSTSVDDIVSETLATIALAQGNKQEAARIYGILSKSATGEDKDRLKKLTELYSE